MTTKLWIGAIFFSTAFTCWFLSAYVILVMIGEINRKVADKDRISYLWNYPGKPSKIFREYKRLYPEGRLNRVLIVLMAGSGFFLLATGWCIGIF